AYGNVGLHDRNRVLKADVTQDSASPHDGWEWFQGPVDEHRAIAVSQPWSGPRGMSETLRLTDLTEPPVRIGMPLGPGANVAVRPSTEPLTERPPATLSRSSSAISRVSMRGVVLMLLSVLPR